MFASAIDEIVARLAANQHGVAAAWQLLDLGVSRQAIKHRVQQRRLHRIDRGIYAVGHPNLTQHGHWIAAVLRVGADSALSHRAAGGHWELPVGTVAKVEVSCPRRLRPLSRIAVHRRPLPADEVTVRNRIPVTTVARTLLDLAPVLAPHRYDRVLHDAERRGLASPTSLPALIDRYRGHRGVSAAREALARLDGGLTVIQSELEALFLAFVEERGLPRPQSNVLIETGAAVYECDFVWHEQRVIVELDGYAHHSGRARFVADRVRDRELRIAGWQPVRATWDDLHRGRERLHRHLAALLERRHI